MGAPHPVDSGHSAVLALRYDAPGGSMLTLTNLADEPCTVDLGAQPGRDGEQLEMFANRGYSEAGPDLESLELDGYGYRWIRLGQAAGR